MRIKVIILSDGEIKNMLKKVRILLVDDQPHVRQGLRMTLALEPDLEVVGEAADGAEVLTLAAALHPDVIVMDVEMPVMDGVTATKLLRTVDSPCAVVMLSLHDDAQIRVHAQAAGAAAFVSKHESPTILMTAIRQAAERSA
jgi:DNA-binding NarL/FixJ family response regulator